MDLSLRIEVPMVMSSTRKMIPTVPSSPTQTRLSPEKLHTKKQATARGAAGGKAPMALADRGKAPVTVARGAKKTSSTLSSAKERNFACDESRRPSY